MPETTPVLQGVFIVLLDASYTAPHGLAGNLPALNVANGRHRCRGRQKAEWLALSSVMPLP